MTTRIPKGGPMTDEETKTLARIREVGNYFVQAHEVRTVQALIDAGHVRRVDRYHVEPVGKK